MGDSGSVKDVRVIRLASNRLYAMHENFFMTKWWFCLVSVSVYFTHWHSDTDCDDWKCRQYVWSMCFGWVTALQKDSFFMKDMYEIYVQYQSLQKLDPQKTLANENNWQDWIRCIPCSIKHSPHQNKCMTNNMARQREQSQDKPAREPLNTTWPTKPAASCWTITTLWARTPVNCMGGRRRDQGCNQG